MHAIAPTVVPSGHGATVVVTGSGFTSSTSFVLSPTVSSRSRFVPAHTLVSPTTAHVVVPPLPNEWGSWLLILQESGVEKDRMTLDFKP